MAKLSASRMLKYLTMVGKVLTVEMITHSFMLTLNIQELLSLKDGIKIKITPLNCKVFQATLVVVRPEITTDLSLRWLTR